MSFFFSPLRSGSSGNTLLVQAGETRLLVDAGLSRKAVVECLAECGVPPETLGAILITHEHSDHIKGVGLLSEKYDLPVYATPGTWRAMLDFPGISRIAEHNRRMFSAGQGFCVQDIAVESFPIPHDAAEPVGYSLLHGGRKLCIATDLGRIESGWMQCLCGADLLLLEANYDPDLLQSHPTYPPYLKARIRGKRGHLSNGDCAEVLIRLYETGLRYAILGHMSAETNRPSLAYETVCGKLLDAGIRPDEDIRIAMAYRDKSCGVFALSE